MRPKLSASFASLESIERRMIGDECAALIQYRSVPCVGVVVCLIFVALILMDFFNMLCLRFVLFTEENWLHLDVCCNRLFHTERT